ncbi:MAG: FkbM family methyltransferase [Bacteroidota bacterium]
MPTDGFVPVTVDGSPHDFTYPARGGMEDFVRSILGGQEYELPNPPGWRPSVVVDVGANVGAFSIYCRSRFPGIAVYAFEPMAEAFSYAERNLAPFPGMTVNHLGLSDRDHSAVLHHGRDRPSQSSLFAARQCGETSETVTLADAATTLERSGVTAISILKVDTEGCEVPILSRLAPWLPSTDLVHLEYHNDHDRRVLDGLMADAGHILWRARAVRPHVGNAAYISGPMAALLFDECAFAISHG